MSEELEEYGTKGFKCEKCVRTFETLSQLHHHSKLDHDDQNRKKTILNDKYSSMEAAVSHQKYNLLARKTQSNLDFSRGEGGGSSGLPDPDFLHVNKKSRFYFGKCKWSILINLCYLGSVRVI